MVGVSVVVALLGIWRFVKVQSKASVKGEEPDG